MPKPEPYFVAIDIGSSKVGVLIGQRDAKGGLEVVGKGLAPNRGTRKGNIVNVEATVEALKAASEEAEVMAGVEISRAYVGVAGADIRSVNSRGMVSVARKDREITRQDIQRVLDAAKSAALPSDREILHAVPQEFIVDEQGGIDDPLVVGDHAGQAAALLGLDPFGFQERRAQHHRQVVGEVAGADRSDSAVLDLPLREESILRRARSDVDPGHEHG